MSEPATGGLVRVHVDGRTDGLLLTLDFEQHYANESGRPIEVTYTFPLPVALAVLGVEASFGPTIAVATPQDRHAAEAAFDEAQESGGLAVTVECRMPGLCTVSVGRVPPGRAAVVRLRTGGWLDVAGSQARIAIPVVSMFPEGSRLGAGAYPVGRPQPDLLAEYGLTLRLTLDGAASQVGVASPTHRLMLTERGAAQALSLAAPAALDRDVVLLLDGLPHIDAVVCGQPGEWLAAVAFQPATNDRPPSAGTRAAANLAVLLDAAGPLSSFAAINPVLLALRRELVPAGTVTLARIGRTRTPMPWTTGEGDAGAREESHVWAADLGDLPIGHSLPPLGLADGADILLITDGASRVAEAVCDLARAEGRRLLVLGAGSAPNEALLRAAANATGGDYAALAPGEDVRPALDRLLGALWAPTVEAVPAAAFGWTTPPVWTAVPSSPRPGRRTVLVAGFDNGRPELVDLPPGLSTMTAGKSCRLREVAADISPAAASIMASRRLNALDPGSAAQLGLVPAGTVWTATVDADTGHSEAKLVVVPPMVAAGWRGVGTVFHPAPPPEQNRKSQRPRAGLLAATLGCALLAAGVSWLGLSFDQSRSRSESRDMPAPPPATLSAKDRDIGRSSNEGTTAPASAARASAPAHLPLFGAARPMVLTGLGLVLAMLLAALLWRLQRRRRNPGLTPFR